MVSYAGDDCEISINTLNAINSVEYQDLRSYFCIGLVIQFLHCKDYCFYIIPTLQAAFTESTSYQVLILNVNVC